ncbi:MAG: hypothetical protein HY735_29660 [Verrucomicrobia bacterium]|nr:hypothetical protein [Verrucomicrobiota bacterium]
MPESTTAGPDDTRGGQIRIESSLLSRAKQDEAEAIQTMFRQFIPVDEELLFAEYLGVQGLWWVGRHSFACLTNRRICSMMVGPWGEVVYQDGLLEHHNSGIVYQPGLLGLYVVCILYILLALVFTLGIGLILFPYIVQWYYRVHKCGLVWAIREGVSVYLFTNRNRLTHANNLYRLASAQHDRRLAELPRSLLA